MLGAPLPRSPRRQTFPGTANSCMEQHVRGCRDAVQEGMTRTSGRDGVPVTLVLAAVSQVFAQITPSKLCFKSGQRGYSRGAQQRQWERPTRCCTPRPPGTQRRRGPLSLHPLCPAPGGLWGQVQPRGRAPVSLTKFHVLWSPAPPRRKMGRTDPSPTPALEDRARGQGQTSARSPTPATRRVPHAAPAAPPTCGQPRGLRLRSDLPTCAPATGCCLRCWQGRERPASATKGLLLSARQVA